MNHPLFKKANLGLVSLSAALLLAACGDTGTTEDPATDPATDPAVEEPADPADDPATSPTEEGGTEDTQDSGAADTANGIYGMEFSVSLDDAVQTFLDTFGQDVNISDVEFEEGDGNYEYHISGWDAEYDYELDVDAQTGEVRDQETEGDTEADHTIDFDNIISPDEALDAAVEAADSDIVEGWTLEDEDGLTVYDVEIENGDDIRMDAATGSIIPED